MLSQRVMQVGEHDPTAGQIVVEGRAHGDGVALHEEPGRSLTLQPPPFTANARSRSIYPTEPSISRAISRFSSTAYSSGNSFTIGSTNPRTIIFIASSPLMPRLIR